MTPLTRLNHLPLPRYLIKLSPTHKPHALDEDVRTDDEALLVAKQFQALSEVEWGRRKAKGERVGNRPQVQLLKVLWVGNSNHQTEGKEHEGDVDVLRDERRCKEREAGA